MNTFNEVSRIDQVKAMKRNDLIKELKNKIENGLEPPKGWSNLKNPELVNLILKSEGEKVEEITPQNPFNEQIIETVIPIDQLNPKVRTKQVTVNFKPLLFPLGKIAKMPKSYYDVLMQSLDKDMQTQMKVEENRMKEV